MIRTIIGIFVFWLTTIGLRQLLEDKMKVKREFSLALCFTGIGLIMFLAGLLNIMKLTLIALVFLGIIYFVLSIKNKKITIDTLKNYNYFIIAFFVYITVISLLSRFIQYDNFSHWALMARNILEGNALPNFEDAVIEFKGYQPGSACFIYFISKLCGNTESSMILGQNYLVFSYLTILLAFIKKQKEDIKNILIFILYIFITVTSIALNSLPVDGLIGAMLISSLGILYYYRKDLKKGFIYSLPISIYLVLVKNVGLVLAGINCLYILYLAFQNKQWKQGIKYAVITGVAVLFVMILWKEHVVLVYGNSALNAKHSLSTSNMISTLHQKGKANILAFSKKYILNLFTLKDNMNNIYLLMINIILLLLLWIRKDKKILKLILAIDLMYLGYWVVLGLMYILSMPSGEANVLASYPRYMSTIMIAIVGTVLIYLFEKEETKLKNILFCGVVAILMLAPIFIKPINAKALIGIDGYEGSKVEKWDNYILPKVTIKTGERYYIYDPSDLDGYTKYLSIYKMKYPNVVLVRRTKQLEQVEKGTVILTVEDEEIREFLQDREWNQENEVVYTK